jgi:hypothetical protein
MIEFSEKEINPIINQEYSCQNQTIWKFSFSIEIEKK